MAMAFEQSKTIVPVLFMLSILVRFEEGLVCAQTGYPPPEEVNALKEIADQLGKQDWDFNLPPCNNNSNWVAPAREGTPLYNSTVYCNCSNANGECHVTHLILRGQELTGTLPASLAKLPYIKYIDFAFNDISGSIPPEWASTKLEILALTGNHLSGQIPESLGNITSLRYMSLEQNLFNGTVPAALGKLINLENLILNSNNLSGMWPIELFKLSNLKELRLSSNNFTGSIPSFQNWEQLKQLELQASGFEGPIHSSISLLTDLIELRISDLNRGVSEFPPLQGLNNLTRLMLRSCNISGPVPSYLGDMTMLRDLDLSFNNLNGEIPNLEGLQYLERLYLTSNWLSGNIPDWIRNSNPRLRVDLSYNNFAESSAPPACLETINLFRSFSARNLESGPCLKRFPCTKDWYSFHINSGGGNTNVGDTKYDADELEGDLAKFFPLQEQWGTSMTGHFLDRNLSRSNYIARNVSALGVNNSELYTSARVSPLSLTYYGRCLANGNYTVTLQFAEIVFTNNRSYQSLGRRIFDVYIQDERVLNNFDIGHEASGVAKELPKPFKAVVKNRTLEIRFHWAGKGTTAVPIRGHYGPLISAISVEAGFKPPSGGKDRRFIVVGVVALVFCCLILLSFLWWKGYLGGRPPLEPELRGLDLQTGIFTFRQIKAATNNFAAENKLGEGGFGSVYKGILSDSTVIAVKQLSSKSKQGNKEFVNEIGMVSGLRHPNLVRLYGCCIEGNQLLLVYEYMEKNNLAFALFGPEKSQIAMDWPTRQRICAGIAKGLAFLHEESVLKIVHRDIKATNVLLDKDLTPKISDFGLAKLYEEENTHVSTRVAGTIGYMAPEYALWGYLTSKADVYSFGVVALELVAGKNNMKYRPDENYVCLLDWALVLQKRGNLLDLVDPRLNSNFKEDEALRMIKIALLCTSPSPALRPTMSSVVGMLEGCISVEELNTNTTSEGDELKFKGLREKYDELRLYHSNETEALIDSSDASLPNRSTSSISTHDLHPASSSVSV